MAFVALVGGISGDLNSATYQYGFFDDTVVVIDGNATGGYTVKSYEGNDVINNARTTINTAPSFLYYAGSGNDTVTGGASFESVHDGSGNDVVRLGAGNDYCYVGSGNDLDDGGTGDNDTLLFGNTTDDGFGSNINTIGVTVDLAKTTSQNLGAFGIDTILDFEHVSGSSGRDVIYGNASANFFVAEDGADVLAGRGGKDTFSLFETASARDTLRYFSITDSGRTAATADFASYFSSGPDATDDRIDLSIIDATPTVSGNQAFVWRGTAAFTSSASGEVRFVVSGSDTLVYIDNDADAGTEMVIKLENVTSLEKTDFIL